MTMDDDDKTNGFLMIAASAAESSFNCELEKIKTMKSKLRRNELKSLLLNNYSEWIDEFQKTVIHTREQGSMFVWLILWNIDLGYWKKSVEMSIHAINNGIDCPDGFTRNLPELITEQISVGITKSGQNEYYRKLLSSLYSLVIDLDMNDKITAKLLKAYGLSYLRSDKNRAITLLKRALEFDSNAGVKSVLNRLSKEI